MEPKPTRDQKKTSSEDSAEEQLKNTRRQPVTKGIRESTCPLPGYNR